MSNTALYSIIGGIALGIVSQSAYGGNSVAFAALLLLLAGFVALFALRSGARVVWLLVLLLIGSSAGALRLYYIEHELNSAIAESRAYVGAVRQYRAVVVDDPEVRERAVHMTARLLDAPGALVRISAVPYHRVQYGDELSVRGALELPGIIRAEHGHDFNYAHYLSLYGVTHVMHYAHIERIGHSAESSRVKSALLALKHLYLDGISRTIPEPEASLAGGITVGSRAGLGESLERDFRTVGLVHIVVLSGFNVTVVIVFILALLAPLPRSVRVVSAIIFVVLFVILVGAEPPVVRAGVMGVIGAMALLARRKYRILRALALSVGVMLLYNPLLLTRSVSFQLSVLATLGLVYIAPHIERHHSLARLPESVRSIIAATLSAQLSVAPLIFYYMGTLSIIAPVVNVLVLPVVPVAMLLSFCAGVLGSVLPAVAAPFGYAGYALLHYIVIVAEFFAQLPVASVTVF